MGITHNYISEVAEGGDPDLVGPNEWNDDHTIDLPYFTFMAASLEPLAIEQLRLLTSSSFNISSGTRLLLTAWNIQLGVNSGKFDMRERGPLPLPGPITIYGPADSASNTSGVFSLIDPSLPTYTDAFQTYYDRMNTIYTTPVLVVAITGANAQFKLLPGPYGSIITGFTCFNMPWLALWTGLSGFSLPFHDENGDRSEDAFRLGRNLMMPVSKNIMSAIDAAGNSVTNGGNPLGQVLYFNCTSSWGAVTDSNSYTFRDDFMTTPLDTSTKWNRTQSTTGNVEIQTDPGVANWCKVLGDGTWGHNGAYSKTGYSRASGRVFECDVMCVTNFSGGTANNIMVGFSDGVGYTDSNFAHCIDFTTGGSTPDLYVFENGSSRGAVGNHFSSGCIYRVRITIQATTSHAKYEIQGGPEYAPRGGSTWTDITPGTTSSTTTPIYAGFTQNSNLSNSYISDIKIYG